MWHKKRNQVELTKESFGRWLRAQRPDLHWFLSLEELVQESMAMMGDEYMADLAVAFAKAAMDPEAAEAGLDAATNPRSEEKLAQKVALGLIRQIQDATGKAPSVSMSGIGKRRSETSDAKERKPYDGTFLGRKPDHTRGSGNDSDGEP